MAHPARADRPLLARAEAAAVAEGVPGKGRFIARARVHCANGGSAGVARANLGPGHSPICIQPVSTRGTARWASVAATSPAPRGSAVMEHSHAKWAHKKQGLEKCAPHLRVSGAKESPSQTGLQQALLPKTQVGLDGKERLSRIKEGRGIEVSKVRVTARGPSLKPCLDLLLSDLLDGGRVRRDQVELEPGSGAPREVAYVGPAEAVHGSIGGADGPGGRAGRTRPGPCRPS
jgi:hypothetical protein